MITADQIAAYRQNGFVHIPNLISREEAMAFRKAALSASERLRSLDDGPIFTQLVNVWQQDEGMRDLTLHPAVGAAATALAGGALRIWHDQILIKQPGVSKATEFHQDQPYWPHADGPNPISAWIALGDVPAERGCMTFLPGSQARTDLMAQNLADERSLFEVCPDLIWSPRVTVPLRAGDATFHHGRCAHMAQPNRTDEARVAHVVIFMEAGTRYTGGGHVVTDGQGLRIGEPMEHPLFPRVA
ncbi:phytanoyl-CoA dioxygenase family protein [soil metagenome]